jgi:hypothetical protein
MHCKYLSIQDRPNSELPEQNAVYEEEFLKSPFGVLRTVESKNF